MGIRVRTVVLMVVAEGSLLAIAGASGCSESSVTAQPAASSTSPASPAPTSSARTAALVAAAADAGAPSTQCSGNTLTLGPIVPGDVASQLNQQDFDCYAWQELIGLNWPAALPDGGPPSAFGDPADTSPVVWETYMDIDTLFNAAGTAPPAWGTQPVIPPACQSLPEAKAGKRPRALTMSAKFSEVFLAPGASAQATPPPNWLGAQNGTNLWYEVRVSQDEYDYIVQNGLYNADNQAAFYKDGGADALITLPVGQMKFGQTTALGALELKAAWMVVTDPTSDKWKRYKKTSAFVYDPAADTCSSVTAALVGLHILHKTSSQPTWVWATFEHVDNVPAAGSDAGAPPYGYNLNSGSCTSQSVNVPANCLPDGGAGDASKEVSVTCAPNTQPPYNLGAGCPGPVPIQVTRTQPLDDSAQTINALAQGFIASANPSSVWQYYQLVNVIWSTNPATLQPQSVPLSFSSPQPPGVTVANTTLETYAQGTTCLDCHKYASIAGQSGYESDFSFIFEHASSPALAKERAAKKKSRAKPAR
jgi:hypothetical protein